MRTRDLSFTIALCASLVVHAVLTFAVTESYVREFGRHIWLPALARVSVEEATTPQLAIFRPEDDPARRLGDSNADGYAIDSSPGQQELLARQGFQDQPFLSRDPIGPGQVGDPPSESLIPPGDGGSSAAAELPPPPASLFAENPTAASPLGIPLPSSSVPADEPPATEATADAPAVASAPPAAPPPAPSAPQPATHDPGPQIAADPAPKAESEIDPVSMIGSVEFRRGSTIARLGRKHKLTRPRITLGGKVDLLTIGETVLVLRLRTDSTGNVISAAVARSSGSEVIDQLFKVTAYEWWFDPPLDASSRPIPDTFLFTIRIN